MTTQLLESKSHTVHLNADIIENCKKGDQRAQFQIYKLYYSTMFNTSLRIVKDSAEAEDIMQESFLSAFEKIDTWSGTVTFGAWLKRIVVNQSISALRKRKGVDFVDIEHIQEQIEDSIDETVNLEENSRILEDVHKAIEDLPDGYRTILSLYLFEGYDHEEISKILSISPSTSRTQFTRAKQKLGRHLALSTRRAG